MDKRLLMALAISIAILIGWQMAFGPRNQPPQNPAAPAGVSPASPQMKSTPETAQPVVTPELEPLLAEQAGQPLQEIKVNTALYAATVTNKGALLKSWRLNDYQTRIYTDGQGWWNNLKSHLLNESEKHPFEMVPTDALTLERYPLGLQFTDEQLSQRVNQAIWRVEEAHPTATATRPAQVKLSYLDPSGLKVTKTIIFPDRNYDPQINIGLENLSAAKQPVKYYLTWNYGIGQKVPEDNHNGHVGPIYLEGEKIAQPSAKDAEAGFKYQGGISWAGLQDTYFAAVFIPVEVTSEVYLRKEAPERLILGLAPPAAELAPHQVVEHKFAMYIGPQKMENLKAAGHNLDRLVDYGWFSFLAVPMTEALKLSHGITGNYGIDIILLTLIIKLLFWPLTASSFKSMKAMQIIQPKMQQLRKKYKDDPQQLNREMLELYRKHKVNPLSGCMPMLLQIPVFIALYKALMVSIELRHAQFLPVWIVDLSAKDPIYVLPILMGASMFWMQKMTPSGGDPAQAKVMAFMPLIFTVMFLKLPAGLVLYWLISNVLTIGQQQMIQRKMAETA